MRRKGVMPMPPVSTTAGRSAWCSRRSPNGPSILTAVPSGMVWRTRLKAVSRRRVVIMIMPSLGALEIEKPRVLPSASVSGGSMRVMSTNWPARYAQSAGLANRNDMVRSATSSRLISAASKVGQATVAVIGMCSDLRSAGSRQPGGDQADQVGDAAAEAPLVVVPGDDLDQRSANHHRHRGVDDRRAAIAAEVG